VTWTSYEPNTEIAKELNRTPLLDKMQDYRRNWIQHVDRMSPNRLPRIIKKNIKPEARRNQGRPLKKLLDM
jgi:uncharacterized membrane protein